MEIGFVIDVTHGGYMQQTWCPGTPIRSFWVGLKLKKGDVVPVVTYRCPNCGYLESYAIPETIPNG
jgi:hypothetical protein